MTLMIIIGGGTRRIWTFNEYGDVVKRETFRDGILVQTRTGVFEYDSHDRVIVSYYDDESDGEVDTVTSYTYEGAKVFRFRESVTSGNKFYDISTYNDEGDLIQFDETDEGWNVIDSDEYEYTYTYDDNDNLIAKKTVDLGSNNKRERNFTYEWQEYEVNE